METYAAGGSWYYEIEDAGYKYNMSDLAAALGLAQLARADELLASRRQLGAWPRESFAASPILDLIELPADEPDGSHAWHLFIVRLHLDRLAIDRAAVIDRMTELGVGTSVHFIPLHLHPYYRRLGWQPSTFPVASAEYERVISLPLWPGMTRSDVDRVVDALTESIGTAPRPIAVSARHARPCDRSPARPNPIGPHPARPAAGVPRPSHAD